jgi:hypothetical protein
MQLDGMLCISSLPPSNPTKGSEGYNHIAQFNVRWYTGTYHTNIRLHCHLIHTKEWCKNAALQCMNFIYLNFNIKGNTTIVDNVYIRISKINFIYHVIWLMWILKLTRVNSNNEWKLVYHNATFTFLLQLSSHKAKHNPKEHHLITSEI